MPTIPNLIKLEFQHIATSKKVQFHSFITDFKDKYVSEWNKTQVYGRMDPIGTFKSTNRQITLAWTVPSNSQEEAAQNMDKAELLISMLYPVFDGIAGSRQLSLAAAPLLRVQLANFICNSSEQDSIGTDIERNGLICSADGFTFDPDMEEGFYSTPGGGALYPQKIAFSCTLTVYHSHELGWNETEKRTKGFPYHAGKVGSVAGATPLSSAENKRKFLSEIWRESDTDNQRKRQEQTREKLTDGAYAPIDKVRNWR